MEEALYRAYVKILEEELVPAMGCTEPIAVAYAGALARQTLGTLPQSVDVQVSANIIKNVKSVVVPHTGGRGGSGGDRGWRRREGAGGPLRRHGGAGGLHGGLPAGHPHCHLPLAVRVHLRHPDPGQSGRTYRLRPDRREPHQRDPGGAGPGGPPLPGVYGGGPGGADGPVPSQCGADRRICRLCGH